MAASGTRTCDNMPSDSGLRPNLFQPAHALAMVFMATPRCSTGPKLNTTHLIIQAHTHRRPPSKLDFAVGQFARWSTQHCQLPTICGDTNQLRGVTTGSARAGREGHGICPSTDSSPTRTCHTFAEVIMYAPSSDNATYVCDRTERPQQHQIAARSRCPPGAPADAVFAARKQSDTIIAPTTIPIAAVKLARDAIPIPPIIWSGRA